MSESSATFSSPQLERKQTRSCLSKTLLVIAFSVTLAAILYQLEPFKPVHFPSRELPRRTITAPAVNPHMRVGSEVVVEGKVDGPEDLAYDKRNRLIYTGCEDGWIKRITVNKSVDDSVVKNWVNTGGRPLGLALEKTGELIVADADLGLLRVTVKEKKSKVEVLANEYDGLKFNLTDGVDVGEDGTIYFTDATYKYNLKDFYFDIAERKPHGRFMSYNPATKKVTLLARNLYFANGVAVAPDQKFVVYCETTLKRCRKFYLQGPKKGRIGEFCSDLPGLPDNIHYVGQGQYLIGMATSITPQWNLLLRYPFLRKTAAMVTKYFTRQKLEMNGGVMVVDLAGKLTGHYYDPRLSLISSGIKVDNYIYCGSSSYPFLLRLDVKNYPAIRSP
ncbi:protein STRICTOSIDINE SYNTHASE-LIKE 6-like [Vicia villosa]|uniref:protein STRICTOSIDINE SYNTHASE-LIKE 6-like n=1 Tax=Vicia villosa TaxID=3911 RepID=UPI00273C6609|nr:protein STRICTOSIDINE SYNTHASE-LIKE 6-like [Vicia villosa]